jgi:glutamate 5-kinase
MIVVVKIGTSSVTTDDGLVNTDLVTRLCHDVATLRDEGHHVVVVTSGAVTAGVATLNLPGGRPNDAITLQALSAIGQHRLMRVYDDALGAEGLISGQVLLVAQDFGQRRQYLHARKTLQRLLELGVVPIVNENDVVADDEIRFGDNDRIAALVANLLGAQLVVLLTDTTGLYDADPRYCADASLLEEVTEIDEALEAVAGGPGSSGSSGGMASKLAAARIASWSGIRVVIAKADRPLLLIDAVHGVPGIGTVVAAQKRRIPARKLWIAFALPAVARIVVDQGAMDALVHREASLLTRGVRRRTGPWSVGDALEVQGPDGKTFAKGIARHSSQEFDAQLDVVSAEGEGRPSAQLINRDDLVVLLGAVGH